MDTICVYKKIEDDDILVYGCKIDGIKGVIIKSDDKCGILINHKELKDSDEEFMVLAHEWGHYASGTLHKFSSDKPYIGRCEYRADRKAVLEFLPLEQIQEAIEKGYQTVYEFSEFLDLPEQFIVKAFKHYKNMGLI